LVFPVKGVKSIFLQSERSLTKDFLMKCTKLECIYNFSAYNNESFEIICTRKLRSLSFWCDTVNKFFWQKLQECVTLKRIEIYCLCDDNNKILFDNSSKGFKNLEYFYYWNLNLHFRENYFPKLKKLCIDYCKIDDTFMENLVGLKNLESVEFQVCDLSEVNVFSIKRFLNENKTGKFLLRRCDLPNEIGGFKHKNCKIIKKKQFNVLVNQEVVIL
jgi:hypothetical protein